MTIPNPGLDRRRLLALGGAGLGAAALAACGGPSTSAPGASGGAGAATPSTVDYSNVKPADKVVFWSNHPGKSQEITQKLIDKFHSSQSAIKVELVTAGANYEEVAQKYQTAQQGGQLPGLVVLSDVWWFRYMLNDSIIPLDGLLSALSYKVDDYRKGLWSDYQYKGKQWAVPWARSTPLFYYNKTMWKNAGLEDRAPKTWEEFADWAPKLKSANAGITAPYMHVAASDYDSWSLQNKVWGYGGAFSKEFEITCDSDDVIKALQFNQDGVYKDKWGAVSAKDAGADFSAGAAACTVTSTGSLVGILGNSKFDVGVGFLPGGPKAADMVCPTGGAGLGIPKAISKEQQVAAATFLKFLTEPENTAAFSEATGYMPVRTSANIDSVIAKRPQAKVALDQLSHTRVQDFARVFLPGGDREIGMASADILTQQADIKARMAKLKTTLQGIYTQDVKPKLG